MQMSATRHSSKISIVLAAARVSFGTGSGVLAIATCTGGGSPGWVSTDQARWPRRSACYRLALDRVCSPSPPARAVFRPAGSATDQARRPRRLAAADPGPPSCQGRSPPRRPPPRQRWRQRCWRQWCWRHGVANSGVADCGWLRRVRERGVHDERWCAAVLDWHCAGAPDGGRTEAGSPSDDPACENTVPHNAVATVASRRGFIIGRLQRLHRSQPSGVDCSDQIWARNGANCRRCAFPGRVARMPRAAGVVHSPTQAELWALPSRRTCRSLEDAVSVYTA